MPFDSLIVTLISIDSALPGWRLALRFTCCIRTLEPRAICSGTAWSASQRELRGTSATNPSGLAVRGQAYLPTHEHASKRQALPALNVGLLAAHEVPKTIRRSPGPVTSRPSTGLRTLGADRQPGINPGRQSVKASIANGDTRPRPAIEGRPLTVAAWLRVVQR